MSSDGSGLDYSPRVIVRERINRVADLPLIQKNDGLVTEMDVNGFTRNMFDRTWRPSLHMTVLLGEQNRPFLNANNVYAALNATFKQKHAGVVATQIWTIHPAYYLCTMSSKLFGRSYTGSFNNRLVSADFDLYDRRTGGLLIQNERKIAFVSGTPFQSIRLPEEGKQFLRNAGVKEVTNDRIALPDAPRDRHVHHDYVMKVAASDMDHMFHVNACSYIRFCADAAYEGGKAGKLPSFPPGTDVAHGRVRKITATYHLESFAGDELTVKTWESEPLTLNFVITKSANDQLICKVQFDYYPPTAKL